MDITVTSLAESETLMKVHLREATIVTAFSLMVISATILATGQIGNVFSQTAGGNMTAGHPNATSMKANITGGNANNTNESAPTAGNTTALNASRPNASLSS
ncbi:MAG TPA: hypothetical protein VF884_08320 [Nitrososphaeraceae archaeon]